MRTETWTKENRPAWLVVEHPDLEAIAFMVAHNSIMRIEVHPNRVVMRSCIWNTVQFPLTMKFLFSKKIGNLLAACSIATDFEWIDENGNRLAIFKNDELTTYGPYAALGRTIAPPVQVRSVS